MIKVIKTDMNTHETSVVFESRATGKLPLARAQGAYRNALKYSYNCLVELHKGEDIVAINMSEN